MNERKKIVEEKAEIGEEKKDILWEADTVEARSETKLESDKGIGREVILRFFEYTANPVTFKERVPTSQELFNAHFREMEIKLWQDGLVPEPAVEPRLLFSKDRTHYKFVIGCRLGRGQILNEKPATLTELTR